MRRTLVAVCRVCVLGCLTSASAVSQCDLLSWDEYNRVHHSFPYILRLGSLLMFGSRHTNDPGDPQLAELERLWREFRPQVAFSEGGIRPRAADHDQAIRRYGEPGLLRFLSDRDQVALRNVEPPEMQEAAAMAARFPPERVKLFYYLRHLSSPADESASSDTRRASALNSVRQRQQLAGPPRSVDEADGLAAALLPRFMPGHEIPHEWFDPARTGTFLNEVARASSEYRNCHIIPLLLEAARSGKRVFVVIGGSHVIVQEPALRSALGSRQ